MKKILLTGYAPPRGCLHDETKDLAEYFDNKRISGAYRIMGRVLPSASIEAFRVVENIIKRNPPDIIINVGTMNAARGIVIETTFKNSDGSNNLIWNTKNAESILVAKSDPSKMIGKMKKKNFQIETSSNNLIAIHNSLGYLVTKILRENQKFNNTQNMFIHVPLVWNYGSKLVRESDEFYMNKDELYKAFESIFLYV